MGGAKERETLGGTKASGMPLAEEARSLSPEMRDNDFVYHLMGIICHQGQATAGHYYSIIRDQKHDRWLKFNNEIVTEYDIGALPVDCFGRLDESDPNENCALLLIYNKSP